MLFQHDQLASVSLDEWVSRLPPQWRNECSRASKAPRRPEKKELAPRSYEGLQPHQHSRLHTDGPNCQEVVRLVQPGVRQKFLEPCNDDLASSLSESTHNFPEKHRFSCLGLDHQETDSRQGQHQRNCRRAPAASDVNGASGLGRYMSGGDERFHEQAVERFRTGTFHVKSGQIYPMVPGSEKPVIDFELCPHVPRNRHANPAGATGEPLLKLTAGHALTCGPCRRRKTERTATAAGVTPGMRAACPSVAGRECVRRCTTSRDSPGID